MSHAETLYAFVRAGLHAHADAVRAGEMQRYMKTDQPFFGVQKPQQRPVFKAAIRDHPPHDAAAWEAGVRALWDGPERELQYAAIAYAKGFPRRRFLTPEALPLLEHLVRTGAWWDLVDDIAANCVGPVVANHRPAMRPVLERWIEDDDLWIRRTAILAQLKHRDDTDVAMLFDFCARQAADKSFWIRKAIGWALRQHARVDPDAVRDLPGRATGTSLSGLSRREAEQAPVADLDHGTGLPHD